MLVPLSWLRDYVALPADPATLIERLTLAGLEAAGTRVFGLPAPTDLHVKPEDAGLVWEQDKVVLAKVLKIEKHPDADKLKLVTVDYGAAEPKTVVTGAPNIAPGQSGMKVVLGLRGTKYFYADKEGKKAVFTLEPKALRGIMMRGEMTLMSPVSRLTTPGGRPASWQHCTIRATEVGASSAGRQMMEQPAASAGAILRAASTAGKFQAAKAATTPTGW